MTYLRVYLCCATDACDRVCSAALQGPPQEASWGLRDEDGINFIRERHYLPPLFGPKPAAAAVASSAAAHPKPAAASGAQSSKPKAAESSAPLAGGKRGPAAPLNRVDLTQDDDEAVGSMGAAGE